MMDTNTKHTTLITGAAKRVGAAIATHLAKAGHDLVLHYNRSGDTAEALAATLRREHKVTVTLLQADLLQPESLANFWQGVPPCTNIIHNASSYGRDTLATMTAQHLREQLAVNLESPLLLTQGFLQQLPAGILGNVIVLGDDALRWSISPHFFSYAVSKHSWRSIIDLLAAGGAPYVRANVIALAPTLPAEGESAEMFGRLAENAPLKCTGSVEEVLIAIDFVLQSPGLTGQVIGLGNGMELATARP